jgi:hypothetical protein
MKKSLIYFMLVAIAAMIVAYLTVGTTSNICEMHRKLFLTPLQSGVVTNKFIDTENHSFETIIIEEADKSFTLLLVPDSNDSDFEKIKIGDTITKTSKSFLFTINSNHQFEFKIDCEYE